MMKYANKHGASGVAYWDFGIDYVDVQFVTSSRVYRYTYQVTGYTQVRRMKQLGLAGRGLSTYIARNKDVLRFI